MTVTAYLVGALCATGGCPSNMVLYRAVQHAAYMSHKARCWLMQANEQLEAQVREAQQAQQASDAQAAELQAAEKKVWRVHIYSKRPPDALQN